MKTTPFVQCTNCRRILELSVEDLAYRDQDRKQHRLEDQPARPDCPCKTRLYIYPKLANDILIQLQADEARKSSMIPTYTEGTESGATVEKPESPPPPSPGRPKKSANEKMAEAIAARKAVELHGSQQKAAEALAVSPQTIRNRLKRLETLEKVSSDDE